MISLELAQTISVNQGAAIDLCLKDHCVGPGDNLDMKAEHAGTFWRNRVSTPPISLVVVMTQYGEGIGRHSSQKHALGKKVVHVGLQRAARHLGTTCSVYLTDRKSSSGATQSSCLHP